ncbi:MAG: flagellar hook-basal body complex protein FliE [Firmicutes bacterium]|nr:flagellar hook-basal body complex protein FliE [Bacillota bacterium]
MHINPSFTPLSLPGQGEEKTRSTPTAFGELFQSALQKVNQQQLEAEEAVQGLISGEIEDLHQVMIATEKARLSLQLTVQVTNKVVEAYKEMTRMQI